jgi:hypothetical protein
VADGSATQAQSGGSARIASHRARPHARRDGLSISLVKGVGKGRVENE